MIPLTFCDVATFYCRGGGGIRTYYNAKLDWFRRQKPSSTEKPGW